MSRADHRTDVELVCAINAGDTSSFDILYRRYRDYVVRLAWRFTRDRDESLDVLQETFAYVLRKFPGFELRASMTTFLYPVVKHLALAHRRKRARATSSSDPDEMSVPARSPVGHEHAARTELATVIAVLPDDQREVVLMRFVDDMSLDDIATALSIAPGTARSRLHRALAKLREDPRTARHFEP